MQEQQSQYEKAARTAFEQTGSPHGVMQPQELVAATTQQWQKIKQNVPIEDRQQFEPILEALLGRALISSPEATRSLQNVVGSNRS